jgi:hypothetical protein
MTDNKALADRVMSQNKNLMQSLAVGFNDRDISLREINLLRKYYKWDIKDASLNKEFQYHFQFNGN